jgi:citrate synthase
MVDSEEAARRLGIKLSTLYSYVSRGILESHPSPEARRRLFDVDEIERIARRGRGARQAEDQSIRIASGITMVPPSGPVYRGSPAAELATKASFEEVAILLWQGGKPCDWSPLDLPPPPEVPMRHRLKWSVLMSGAKATLAPETQRVSIVDMASSLVATIIDTLPNVGDGQRAADLILDDGRRIEDSLAARLTTRLTGRLADEEVVRAVNAALILLADHELTPATLAVRIAASTRATYHDAMLVGVSSASARSQGSASELAHSLLVDSALYGVEQAMDDALRHHGVLPGFGRRQYEGEDPRFTALKPVYERIGSRERLEVVQSVLELASVNQLPQPSVDVALAAVMFASEMTRTAGLIIFTIARLVGWTAHYLEELEEPPLRFRPMRVG